MKYILILYFFIASAFAANGQCYAQKHDLGGPFHPEWVTAGHGEKMYAEEDMCDYDGWALVWEDDFDLGYLDQNIWQPGYYGNESGSPNEGTTLPSPLSNNTNYSVSGGILSLTTTYDDDPLSPNYRKTQNAGIATKRQFPSGKVIVRIKAPAISVTNIDLAPLWMRSTLDYTDGRETSSPYHEIASGAKQYYANEMDIELFGDTRSQGQYTLHSGVNDVVSEIQYNDDNHHTSCFGGDISDGNWHILEIEWDMWHVNWSVDGTLANSLARTYANHWTVFWPFPIPFPDYVQQVSECDGPALSGYYHRDWMFPLFANFPIYINSLSAYGSHIDQSVLPYTMQVDYVKFYRKVKCDKNLVLPPSDLNPTGGYRSAGGIGCDRSGGDQVPPTLDNQTPSIITGRTITVGQSDGSVPYIFRRDDYRYDMQQNLDLMAIESVTLMPGFETDLLYQANGPCSVSPYGPHYNGTEIYGNNWTIQDAFTASIIDCPPSSRALEIPNPPANIAPVRTSPPPAVSTNFAIKLYPNPTNGVCTLSFNLPAAADVTITLTDITGRSFGTIDQSWHNQGTSSVTFSTQGYAPGIYLVKFSDGTNTSTQRLTIGGK